MGECGLRGGYFELHNFTQSARDLFYKLKSIELCSNTIGQVATGLMVDAPRSGVESNEVVNLYEKETSEIFNGLKARAQLLTESLNSMTNISCSEIQGAMYAFPTIKFSKKALSQAKKLNLTPDTMYCMDLVENTGIMSVPGSGFGQKKNEYHMRITNLVTPTERMG